LLSPVRLKKFYLVVAKRYETKVLEEMASLNAAQLVDAREVAEGEAEGFEAFDRFLRMEQRCSALLESISTLKARFPEFLPPARPVQLQTKQRRSMRITHDEIGRVLDQYGSKLDELNGEADKLLGEIENLNTVRSRLSMLQTIRVGADALGAHTFTVVRAGLVDDQALPKLAEDLSPVGAVHEESRISPEESLIVVVAPKESEEKLDEMLMRSGFQEFELPRGLDSDQEKALVEVGDRIKQRMVDLSGLEGSVAEMADELAARTDYVNFLREATTVLSRTRDLSVTQGWIVETAVPALREKIAAVTSDAYYLQVLDPKKDEQAPVLLPKRGWLLKGFELLTSIRGTPSYNEMDPTIVFALLFPLMYGMMFGDVGDGAVILLLGLLLYRAKRSLIGISAHALNSIGTIMVVGGISGIIFGLLYGSVFLVPGPFAPLLFEPISAFSTIVVVALAFGVVQLTVSLILNIRNHVARREWKEAVFSGKGVVGLSYYLLGMLLAARLIEGGLQLSLFVSPENLPITAGALLCLLLIFLSPLIRNLGTEDGKTGKDIIEGFGEFIEVFISFITNSLSYLRLAAFAIAHGIFASFAVGLGGTIGVVSSLILVNALVIVVEGFAVGIQSIRLLYYEFSTKFFSASGQRFKPLSLKLTEGSQS
jgi:V/A-type H+-transporting ATPase subunit I